MKVIMTHATHCTEVKVTAKIHAVEKNKYDYHLQVSQQTYLNASNKLASDGNSSSVTLKNLDENHTPWEQQQDGSWICFHIKNEIKAAREILNLSQEQLAEKSGYSVRSIQAIEQGQRKVPARLTNIIHMLRQMD